MNQPTDNQNLGWLTNGKGCAATALGTSVRFGLDETEAAGAVQGTTLRGGHHRTCVRWYLRYKLSSRDLVEMMGERGIELAHTTILRWVQRYVPEFEKRWNQYARTVGGSWRCDETYIKVKGRWTYLYRAVDKQGQWISCSRRSGMSLQPNVSFKRR